MLFLQNSQDCTTALSRFLKINVEPMMPVIYCKFASLFCCLKKCFVMNFIYHDYSVQNVHVVLVMTVTGYSSHHKCSVEFIIKCIYACGVAVVVLTTKQNGNTDCHNLCGPAHIFFFKRNHKTMVFSAPTQLIQLYPRTCCCS